MTAFWSDAVITQGMNGRWRRGTVRGPGAGGRGVNFSRISGDIFRNISFRGALRVGGAAARPHKPGGADLRYDMQSPRKKRSTGKTTEVENRGQPIVRNLPGTVRARHRRYQRNANATCATAWARVRAKQGLFVIERALPDQQPVAAADRKILPRIGRGEGQGGPPEQALQVRYPARRGLDHRHAYPAGGRARARQVSAARRGRERPLSSSSIVQPHPWCSKREGTTLMTRVPGDLHHRRRSEAVSKSPILNGSTNRLTFRPASSRASRLRHLAQQGPACRY